MNEIAFLFHDKACYGIVQVPKGPWFCRKCESQERIARVVSLTITVVKFVRQIEILYMLKVLLPELCTCAEINLIYCLGLVACQFTLVSLLVN